MTSKPSRRLTDITRLTEVLASKQTRNEKGKANGYAGLDADARPPFVAGREIGARLRPGLYYAPEGAGSSTVTVLDRISAVPFFIPRRVTLDRIAINVTVAAATAGSQARLGIYADIVDDYGGYPGNLVSGSTGSVATDAIAFVAATIDVTLDPGLYWLAAVTQTATCTVSAVAGSGQVVGHGSSTNAASRNHYAQTGVSGALPSTFSTTVSAQGNAPAVQVRVV